MTRGRLLRGGVLRLIGVRKGTIITWPAVAAGLMAMGLLGGCAGAMRHAPTPLAAAKGAILLHSQIRYPYSIRAMKVGLNQKMLFQARRAKGKIALAQVLRSEPLQGGCHTIGVWVVLRLKASPFGKKHYSMVKKVVFGVRGGRAQKVRILLKDQGMMYSFYNRIKVDVEQHPAVGKTACKSGIKPEEYQFRLSRGKRRATPQDRGAVRRPAPRR